MSERESEALKRLEQDYLRGAIDAEEYARLRAQVLATPESAEAHPPPYGQPIHVQPPTQVQPAQVQPPPGYAPGTPAVPYYALEAIDPITNARLAGWGRRVAATLLDGLILTLALVPTFVWWAATLDPVTEESSGAAVAALLLQSFLAPFLYTWVMLGVWGQTLGKMALGIAVRRGEDAARLGFARALGRTASVLLLALPIFLYIPLLLSYLWPLWDGRNQTLHDKMANTIVVKV